MKKGYLRILEHPRFLTCEKILVAVSGGPDSMATLDKFYKKYGERVEGLFVNHHTKESGTGREVIVKYFSKDNNGVTNNPQVLYRDIDKYTIRKEHFWHHARQQEFLNELTCHEDAILITGHNLDDAVEEYLINTMKRSIARTLKYNYPNPNIFRPMLLNKKENFVEYCFKNNIPFVDSSGGLDLRNKIRRSTVISNINEVLGTNLERIVRKQIHIDYELSKVKRMATTN